MENEKSTEVTANLTERKHHTSRVNGLFSSSHHNEAKVVVASEVTTRQALKHFLLACSVFSLLGFMSGAGETLNKEFQEVLQLSKAQSAIKQIAFFSAYLVGPLTYLRWILTKYGYKTSIVFGLLLIGAADSLFYVAGHFQSFPAFCVLAFAIGTGVCAVDMAIFPYITNIGPAKSSEIRCNLAMAVSSVVSVASLIMASYLFLQPVEAHPNISAANALRPIQWVWLGAGIYAFILAALFLIMPIVEIGDDVLDRQLDLSKEETGWEDKPLKRKFTFWWGFVALLFFHGSNVGISPLYLNYTTEISKIDSASAARLLAITHTIFAVMRVCVSILMKWVKPRKILLGSTGCTVVFLSAAIATKGYAGLAMISLEIISKACIFPTIYSISMRGLGRHTRLGSAILITSVSSGLIFAPSTSALADKVGTRISFVIPLFASVVAISFPIYINLCKARELDGFRKTKFGIQGGSRRSSSDNDTPASPADSESTELNNCASVKTDIGEDAKERKELV